MNEQGFSYIESILAVSILFILSSTIPPMQIHMRNTMEDKLVALWVSEVAYNGALSKKYYDQNEGSINIDRYTFYWMYLQQKVCVQYEREGAQYESCISDTE